MKILTRSASTALLLGVALIVGACATTSSSPLPSDDGGAPVDAGGDWRLVRGTSGGVAIPLVPGSDITMTVDGSRIAGRSACNQYGGEIIVKDGRIQFGPLMMTEMACQEPIMASEAAYMTALAAVRAAMRDGDRLSLVGDGVELIYERVVPPPAADLVGTTWALDSIVSGDAVSSVANGAVLQMRADGTLGGSTGCRTFTGTWIESAGRITVTLLPMDAVECVALSGVQDNAVSGVLEAGFAAIVDGRSLTLTASDGRGLVYRALDG